MRTMFLVETEEYAKQVKKVSGGLGCDKEEWCLTEYDTLRMRRKSPEAASLPRITCC